MTEHLPECPKSGCEACYEQGQRDALSAAREALLEGRPDPGISEKQAIANYAIYQNGYAFGLGKARDALEAKA